MMLSEINQEFAHEQLYWYTLINALRGKRPGINHFWTMDDINLDLHALHTNPDALNPRKKYLQVFRVAGYPDVLNVTLTMTRKNSTLHTVRFETRDVLSSESDWGEFVENRMNEQAAKGMALDIESDIISWTKSLKPHVLRRE